MLIMVVLALAITPQSSVSQCTERVIVMQICYRLGRAVGRILFVLLLVGITMLPAQGQAFSLLHSFYGPEGASPRAALIQGRDGALYGTTPGDTLHNQGSIFKIHMDGTGFQSLRTFEYNKSDGANLNAALLQGQDGALYGTTTYNQGTVFKLNMDGSGFQTIHSFRVGPIDGPSGLISGQKWCALWNHRRVYHRFRPGDQVETRWHGLSVPLFLRLPKPQWRIACSRPDSG